MTPDTIYIIASVILAAVGVIAVRRNEITDIRADIRELRAEMREEVRELRTLLTAHITGHSHSSDGDK